MHIIKSTINNTLYCYVAECNWDSVAKKYVKPSKIVGKIDGENRLIPNKFLSDVLTRSKIDPKTITKYEQQLIATIHGAYGEHIKYVSHNEGNNIEAFQTATIIYYGPQLVFEGITKRYKIDSFLKNAFGEDLARDILSLAWYITSEGSALSNNDSWLDYFENPRGCGFRSQEITKLLDCINYDGIMTFYKFWLKGFTGLDKVLYDLTSISYYGSGIHAADWGYNRDHENLPQINYALLCMRDTAMPIFAWPLIGSISDVVTLESTLQFLEKLGYKPNCLMMDRGFASIDNIAYLLKNKYKFLQALKVNAKWICDIIDAGEVIRFRPDSQLKHEERTYYASTTHLKLVHCQKRKGNTLEDEIFFCKCKGKGDRFQPDNESVEVLGQYPCQAHVLFCQDLVGNSWDRFMENLNYEFARLQNDPNAKVKPEYAPYFVIDKPKYARKRTIDFNMEAVMKHKNKYAGYICFLTNDPTINSAEDALNEYSTRDYIEKDFDEMKNGLDMNRIRVHKDERMRARLFIQFIAEIFLREIRLRLRESKDCCKMTKAQIFSHIKTISKIHFRGRYKDVKPKLSKKQRSILEALDIEYTKL